MKVIHQKVKKGWFNPPQLPLAMLLVIIVLVDEECKYKMREPTREIHS